VKERLKNGLFTFVDFSNHQNISSRIISVINTANLDPEITKILLAGITATYEKKTVALLSPKTTCLIIM